LVKEKKMAVEKISAWVSLITGPASLILAFSGWRSARQSIPYAPPESEILSVAISIMAVFFIWVFIQSVHVRICVSSVRKLGDVYGFFLSTLLSVFLAGILFSAVTLGFGFTIVNLISTREIYLSAGAITVVFLMIAFLASLFIAAEG
jgi:hypothetical protein